MKKVLSRRVGAVLAAAAALLSFPMSAAAAPRQAAARVLSSEQIEYMKSLEVYSEHPLPSMDIDPGYIDFDTGVQKDAALPSTYDLRSYGRITTVRRQGDFGTCWAHSALGSAESILITRGIADSSIDLSEKHLAYYTFNDTPDKLGNTSGDYIELTGTSDTSNYLDFGGTINYSTSTLASWQGAVDEKEHSEFVVDLNDMSERYRSYDRSLAYSIDKYHMTDCLWIAPYDTNALKRYIMEYGAAQTPIYWSPVYMNYNNGAYYCTIDYSINCNHQVLVAGWDDNYSASNFSGRRPSRNGAWLCRNTWGTDWGVDGYFWMSYEDFAFSHNNSNVIAFDILEPVGRDYNIYQYDGGCYISSIWFPDAHSKTAYSAAVFSAAENDELLSRVEFFTDMSDLKYNIQIYTGVGSEKPNSGKPMLSKPLEGTVKCAGLHSVELPELLPLSAGERFSVILRLSTGDDRLVQLPIDSSKYYSDSVLHGESHPGETFYSVSGSYWTDADDYDYTMRVKACTVKFSEDDLHTVTVTGGTASARDIGGKYYEGQQIKITAGGYDFDRYRFDHWETFPDDVLMGSRFSADTTMTMPRYDTTVTAVLKEVEYVTDITRLSGSDRFATSAAISSEGWTSADTVIIASGANYPDALAASPLARLYDAPVLLVDGSRLSDSVYSEMTRLAPDRVIIIGGTAAVSSDIERQLYGMVSDVERIAGGTRYKTAALIASRLVNKAECFLVSGRNYPDALSVSAVAAAKGCPILYLEPSGDIPYDTAQFLMSAGTSDGVIIGGTAAIGAGAEAALADIGVSALRISGSDRYATSLSVCGAYGSLFDGRHILLATGANFPDALSGAALAARVNMPVVLTVKDKVWEIGNYVTGLDLDRVYVAGGVNAVPSEILYSLFEGTRKPDEPSSSDVPETPDEPSSSDVPETPDEPSSSDVPETPDEPSSSDVPETPDEPSSSDVPETPDEPSSSDVPETPDEPSSSDVSSSDSE